MVVDSEYSNSHTIIIQVLWLGCDVQIALWSKYKMLLCLLESTLAHETCSVRIIRKLHDPYKST